jgi:L-threonylcarbamoyladenylate synthase
LAFEYLSLTIIVIVMEVIELRLSLLPTDDEGIRRVAGVVRGGGLIVYPTDTLYGIGCDPFNQSALERVCLLKGREGKALPVLVSGIGAARALVAVERVPELLMGAFWPGALTLVLKEQDRTLSLLSQGTGKVGVRMPRHELALRIIGASGGALVGTSANMSGMRPARSVDELDPRIEGGVDLVVDGGPTELGVASTVLEVKQLTGGARRVDARIRVLREGALGIDAIKRRAGLWRREGIRVDIV